MKRIILHSVPVFLSIIWLIGHNNTYNPITLKGPDFLKFYIILLTGFYFSIFILTYLNKTVSKTTFYFLMVVFLLGIVKVMRGLYLGKPIGYLVMILIIEIFVILFFRLIYFNKKCK